MKEILHQGDHNVQQLIQVRSVNKLVHLKKVVEILSNINRKYFFFNEAKRWFWALTGRGILSFHKDGFQIEEQKKSL